MESGEENAGRYGEGAPVPDAGNIEPSASPRPPVLTPEVESRSDLDSPFGALSKSLPDVIERAKGFYTRHPTLVKTVGTVFVAAIARRLFRGRPGLF
jgi:hypothetical protein